ncbi:MAG: penicillin-binding protein 1A [Granulosicoccaceae bacterium]
MHFKKDLPEVSDIREVELYVPLQVFSSDGELLAEYGEKRRIFAAIDEIPLQMQQAFVAAEDDRFYEHPGVDWQGLARAVYVLVTTGKKAQGGSTITMQIARNLFLDNDKKYSRKFKEMLLAMEIERELSKDEILELYLNKIFFGNRAWGVGAAAFAYYGKSLQDLELAEIAMIAGLPKAPSAYNPIANPTRAVVRRNYVLRRMRELSMISQQDFDLASVAPVTAELHVAQRALEGGYVAEMVRADLVERFGDSAYSHGYRVYTTLTAKAQRAATESLRRALHAYEERHGYRGPLAQLDEDVLSDEIALSQALADVPQYGDLSAAAVLAVESESATIQLSDGGTAQLPLTGVLWARKRLSIDELGEEITRVAQVLSRGDLIYVSPDEGAQLKLSQLPEPEGAFVALDPKDGAVLALAGGYQFERSKFNRVTQASRQSGSNFKPFVFSAALDAGLSVASVFNDAPVVFDDDKLEDVWRPENYSGRVYGPTRLREALVKSRNLVSIRVLRKIGIKNAINYIDRFGMETEKLPRDLSLALGSGVVKPIDLVRAYAVFANNGYLIEPYFIRRIEDRNGKVLHLSSAQVACEDELCLDDYLAQFGEPAKSEAVGAESEEGELGSRPQLAQRVLEEDNAFLMNSMLREVVRRGTAVRAGKTLARPDIAGKTGTTNEQMDAWFTGFHPEVVATAWVGFDQVKTLGSRETGGRAALPMWIDFMQTMLDGVPQADLIPPDNVVRLRIDKATGKRARAGADGAMFEYFRDVAEEAPEQGVVASEGGAANAARKTVNRVWNVQPSLPEEAPEEDIRDQLF